MNLIIKKNVFGFTLVEMTVVLVIIGLLLAGLLVPLREGVKQERRTNTEEDLKTIEQALYGFAVSNGRLPCPDCRNAADGNCAALVAPNAIRDGQEDFDPASPNDCAADPVPGAGNAGNIAEGNIPWATLGIPSDDEWDTWFRYAVSDSAADIIGNGTPGNINPPGLPACVNAAENLTTIDVCPVGTITIQTQGTTPGGAICPLPAPANNVIAQGVFAVVISHGENIVRPVFAGPGQPPGIIVQPPLCSEQENYTTPGVASDGIYVSSNFINPGEPGDTPVTAPNQLGYDDQVIWISPNILKSKLVQAGRLP